MIKRLITFTFLICSALTAATAQTGPWSGKLDVQGSGLSLVFHLDDENPTMDSPDQGVRGIPVLLERNGGGKITIRVPSIGAGYEGVWLIKQIVGTFTQMNLSFPLTLTSGEEKPARPQTPQGPFPYQTEEVSFANGDIILNGTLTLPEGYTRNTAALVMVTGSGLQNRDEELFDHKPFAVIADILARAGIATLRYDDRGFNGYDKDINACTTEDFKNDALAGISLLRDRFDKVGVLGHSEGGTIALMLAAEKEADFIVSLAGMVISGAETLLWQNRKTLIGAGLPEDAVETYCRLLADAFDRQINGGNFPSVDLYDLPETLKQNYQAALAQIRTPYMSHLLSLDMRQILDGIDCPVMALNGTKDLQVEAERNLDALRNGLKASSKNHIEAIYGVNHLFQHCTTGSVSEYRSIEETFAPEVLDKITHWLSQFIE